jgi:hypothetical protein
MKGASIIAADRFRDLDPTDLSIPERVLLFCVASGTEWERAGVTGPEVTAAIVRGLVQRDPAGQLWLTKEGRTTFKELIER